MKDSELRTGAIDLPLHIISVCDEVDTKKGRGVLVNQIVRSATSIGANIREAQYAHSKADFIAKLQIALKEANETGYWLELLFRTGYLQEEKYKFLDSACTGLRVMLIASINTAKGNNSR